MCYSSITLAQIALEKVVHKICHDLVEYKDLIGSHVGMLCLLPTFDHREWLSWRYNG